MGIIRPHSPSWYPPVLPSHAALHGRMGFVQSAGAPKSQKTALLQRGLPKLPPSQEAGFIQGLETLKAVEVFRSKVKGLGGVMR